MLTWRQCGGAVRWQVKATGHLGVRSYPVGVRISELAKRSGVPPRTVRYYADLKLISSARRAPGGERVFEDAAMRQLRFVRRMQHLGLSLAEIAQLLRATEQLSCKPSSRLIVAQLRGHVSTVESQLRELEAVKHELAALLASNERGCSDDLCLCASVSKGMRSTGRAG